MAWSTPSPPWITTHGWPVPSDSKCRTVSLTAAVGMVGHSRLIQPVGRSLRGSPARSVRQAATDHGAETGGKRLAAERVSYRRLDAVGAEQVRDLRRVEQDVVVALVAATPATVVVAEECGDVAHEAVRARDGEFHGDGPVVSDLAGTGRPLPE